MRKLVLVLCLGFSSISGFSQSNTDLKYLEDQIYLTLSYDNLIKTPKKFEHNGFSGSFSMGFIKDIPINTSRNIGFGVGIGYGYTAYIQNLKIENSIGEVSLVGTDLYNTNWLKQHKVEVPIEIRFRGSTAAKYKFWRIYTGLKLSYLIGSKSMFQDDTTSNKVTGIELLEKFQYGAIFSAGFSTWNLYLYYGLKPLFKDLVINTQRFNAKEFKIGLNFYIM